jgi:hypothetical protein
MYLTPNPTWTQSQTNECIELNGSVITYKVGTLGDIPSTDVLIKGTGHPKHFQLTREKNGNMIFVENPCSVKGHASVMDLTLNPTWKQDKQLNVFN